MISHEHPSTAPAPGSAGRAAGAGATLLRVDGVSKRWPKAERPLLEQIDLELPAGTLALVVGQNGTGKTTLLRIVAGIIAPDVGSVELDGVAPRRRRREYHRRVGFLSAGSMGLYARLTVAQHLAYWAGLAFVPRSERATRISEAMERFELDGMADRRADRLSMGQRQRLRLALALLHRPSLLLLDEPWNSLDDKGIDVVNAAVREFGASGGSGLFCTPTGHQIDVPADRLYVLENGRLELS
jgi:ABC-2 type transport system ATP-binding protein